MAYTTLNKMVTVFINNICSFVNNFTLDVESQNIFTMTRKVVIVPNVSDM